MLLVGSILVLLTKLFEVLFIVLLVTIDTFPIVIFDGMLPLLAVVLVPFIKTEVLFVVVTLV